jgi:hypothetical protein
MWMKSDQKKEFVWHPENSLLTLKLSKCDIISERKLLFKAGAVLSFIAVCQNWKYAQNVREWERTFETFLLRKWTDSEEHGFHHMTTVLSKCCVWYDYLFHVVNMTAHASVSGHLNTGRTLCEQQRECRWKCSEMQTGGGKNLLSSCLMLWKLYYLSPVNFFNKNVKMHVLFLGNCVCLHMERRNPQIEYLLKWLSFFHINRW